MTHPIIQEVIHTILTEEHFIRKNRKTKDLYGRIDDFCYSVKNLYNSVNYLIIQCSRISRKLSDGEILEEWETEMLTAVNTAVTAYNNGRKGKKQLAVISAENGFIADAYFLSWYLKGNENYRLVPYATCSQVCIQDLCREWKSFYHGIREWQKKPQKFTGRPRRPGYLDKTKGRSPLVLTSQNVRVTEDGFLQFPKFLSGLLVRARHDSIRQVRIVTEAEGIRVRILYGKDEEGCADTEGVMGIDLGVNNLMAVCTDRGTDPVIISGKPVKSINQYFNKQKASLQAAAMKSNRKDNTRRIDRLTGKRNRKIKDYMHKASRKLVELATREGIHTIIIGKNAGWKQNVSLGNKTNQNFTSIPHGILIQMITYKAQLAGIKVIVNNESYTSGTSWLDGEAPEKENYDKTRRIYRGLFRSNTGLMINADVNAAYQIMARAGYGNDIPKRIESIRLIKVS